MAAATNFKNQLVTGKSFIRIVALKINIDLTNLVLPK
jgi:hypothetical protein